MASDAIRFVRARVRPKHVFYMNMTRSELFVDIASVLSACLLASERERRCLLIVSAQLSLRPTLVDLRESLRLHDNTHLHVFWGSQALRHDTRVSAMRSELVAGIPRWIGAFLNPTCQSVQVLAERMLPCIDKIMPGRRDAKFERCASRRMQVTHWQPLRAGSACLQPSPEHRLHRPTSTLKMLLQTDKTYMMRLQRLAHTSSTPALQTRMKRKQSKPCAQPHSEAQHPARVERVNAC